MNIFGLLEKHLSNNSCSPFIDYNGSRLNYGDILTRAERLSAEISGFGFKRGAVCALICFNHINFILYFTACLKSEIIPIIINPKYSRDEIQSLIGISEIKTIITDNAYAFSDAFSSGDGRKINIITPQVDSFIPSAGGGLCSDTLDDGTLFMLITSASGGRPKIVKKNAGALSYQAEKLYPSILSCHGTRYFTNVPASHSYGLEFAVFGSIFNGVPLFLRDFGFAADVMDEIAFNEITHIFSIPPFILNLADYKKHSGLGFDKLEMVISAGMPLMPGLAKKFHAAFNFNIASVYGITEAGCVSFNGSKKGGPESAVSINNDVGLPLEGNHIAVLDDLGEAAAPLAEEIQGRLSEDDSDLIRGNIGRVVIRKKISDGGYYKFSYPDGASKWRNANTELETDDSGYIDSTGALHLLARTSSFVNIGGIKVNASDIEAFLRSTGLFKEVLVFGRTDSYLGEKIAAAVVVDDNFRMDAAGVRDLCMQKLPPVKVPRDIYLLKTAFPKTSTGKVRFDKVLQMVEEVKDAPAAD